MELVPIQLSEIRTYENNPRKNDDAVEAVAESIRQCGYIAPIIIDENNVILAGHTRYKALEQLDIEEVPCIIKTGLTDEQKRKYRVLDNKTSEFAGWDFAKLEQEIADLDFGDFDFGFGNQEELDASDMDNFFADAPEKEKKPKQIQCPHCGEYFEP